METGSARTGANGGRFRGFLREARAALPILLVMAATFAADQVSKYVVRENLGLYESWPATGFFRFTYGTNSGTAFGLFTDQTTLLTIASVAAIGFIIYFHRMYGGQDWISKLTIGLLLGGAFGNLLDRVVAGEVTDFIDVGPWPIFNIADSSIVVGISALVIRLALWGNLGSGAQAEGEDADESGGGAPSEGGRA